MEGFVTAIAVEVAKCQFVRIGRHFGYLFKYRSNVEDLRSQLGTMGDTKGRVLRDVDAAKRNGDEIEPDVENWLKRTDGIIEDANKVLGDEGRGKCFNGLCPSLKSRYQLSKKAKKTAQIIIEIREKKFDRVSYRVPLRDIESRSSKSYEAFESRVSTFNGIIEALKNPNFNLIGLYGMGGAGKSTLVKEIARRVKEEKVFEQVVMHELSGTPDSEKIQGIVADELDLKLDQVSVSGRAKRLHEMLKKEKSILIILDNIWERLDLEAVGIPFGDDHRGCKILLTSRNQHVLSNVMNTQKNFPIGELTEEEALTLFKKMAGDWDEVPNLQPTVIEDVAKKCAGLPIAIVAVAKALKNKPSCVWEDALQQLRGSKPANILGMHANVYLSLELSYNHLESDELKSLFLLIGLVALNTSRIKDLLKYSMGLGLFRDINILEEARNRIHTLVHNLKDSSLLLESTDVEFVNMHDVVRDVAMFIASKDQNGFMLRYGVELKEWPKKDILKDCTALSFSNNNIHELPEGLECRRLEFFYLHNHDPALKIPDTFFKEMTELKVLDLTGIHFSSLPSSLQFLANLQTLCLDYCMFGDIAMIGELKNLEILSLIGSDIIQLPREIAQLTHLRLLDLKRCSKLQVIPPNVISSLSKLEELWMENSFVGWEADGLNSQRYNASLNELKNLSCLTALAVQIRDAGILPKDLLFEKLIRYRILVSDVWDWTGNNVSSTTLKLKLNTSIHLEDGVKMLLKGTEDLYLDELMGVKNILYELDREGFRQLKHLHVQFNPEIQHIINSKKWVVPCHAFPILESLFLKNLTSLEEICHGQLPMESFGKLRVIEVEYCDKLKNLFSLSKARGLVQLQEMEISDCKIMDGIVAVDEAMDNIMFPQLRCLTLQRLPELLSFCSDEKLSSTNAGSGEIISEGEHEIPKPLFDKKDPFPSLEFLRLSELSKLKQIWHGQRPVETCNLRELVVEKCALLLNIASSNLLQSLQNLETISVESCDSLEEVFDLQGLNCDEEHAAMLSNLYRLRLIELDRLRCIWNMDPLGIVSFQNLKSMEIERCGSLKNLFSLSMALTLVQLQTMRIENCDMMEEIVEKEKGAREEAIHEIVFPQLRVIVLDGLPNLRSFYPGNHSFESPSLEIILIDCCPKIETFVSTYESLQEISCEGATNAPFFNKKVSFSMLKELYLGDLSISMAILKMDPQGIFPFQKLHSLNVCKCHHLRNIFTTSMAKSLLQLQKLFIWNCEMIEEIVGNERVEEAAATMDRVVFPQITSLTLASLPRLKSFCQGIHILELPLLKNLMVWGCDDVKIFASELISFEETYNKGHLGIPNKKPLFLVDKVAFHNLEEMVLMNMSSMEEIWQGQFHARSFCKLTVLQVKECNKIFKVFPASMLQNLQNLEELRVKNCSSLEELFELERPGGDVGHASTLPRLRDFSLKELPKLVHLWKEDSQLCSIFQNLTTLKVRSCGSLTHLFPSTIVESLQQIKSITVADCEMMKEIIASEKGKATNNETTFNQLNSLKLIGLPNLTSFCTSSIIYSFPSLEEVLVNKCPKLKTFSNNILRAPKLENVQVKEDVLLWDGDLNTTIQQLFMQKSVQVSKDD